MFQFLLRKNWNGDSHGHLKNVRRHRKTSEDIEIVWAWKNFSYEKFFIKIFLIEKFLSMSDAHRKSSIRNFFSASGSMEPLKKFFVEKLFLKKISKRNFFTKNFCVAKVFLRKKIFQRKFFSLGLREKESCPTATDQWSLPLGSPSLSFTLAHRSHVLPPKT